MKIVVFGATGGTGKIVVEQLLEQGHYVTAYVRNPDKVHTHSDRLMVVHGDIYDEQHVAHIIKGNDAVISCLGSNTLKQSNQLTRMATHIVNGMRMSDVWRFAYMATAGIDNEIGGIMGLLSKIVIGNVINDHKDAVAIIKASEVTYTIARPVQLKDERLTKDYNTALKGLPKSKKAISRANVANFLVEAITNETFMNQSVGLTE